MGFVDGFFTFSLQISLADRNIYESTRVKTAKHPEEPMEHLVARVLALVHSFESGIEFSEGLYKPEQPAIQVPDGIGGLNHWADVGSPELKKVRHALSTFHTANFAIYFYTEEQRDKFCHSMRGTKKNWIAPISFYFLSPRLISDLASSIALRNSWSCTLVDSSLYVEHDSLQTTGTIEKQDIWQQYQESIGNVTI